VDQIKHFVRGTYVGGHYSTAISIKFYRLEKNLVAGFDVVHFSWIDEMSTVFLLKDLLPVRDPSSQKQQQRLETEPMQK
jgi:hypothetical protein